MTKIPRLFKLMEVKKITAKKLSEDIGISTGNISDWKNGRSSPTLEKIQVLSDYFDVSTDYLLGKTDIPKVQNIVVTDKNGNQMALDDETLEYIDSLRTRPEMRVLFSVTNKATKEDIIKAVKIIEALKNESE